MRTLRFDGVQTITNYGDVQFDGSAALTPTAHALKDLGKSSAFTYVGGDPPDCQTCSERPDNYLSGGSAVGISEGNLRDAYEISRLRSAFGVTIDFSLHYNSYNADGSRAAIDTVMGYGWTHSYNVFLFSQNGHMFRMGGDGRVTKFQRNLDGSFTTAPGYFETLLQISGATFTITTKDKTVSTFALIPNTPFAVGGPVYRLTSIVDRNHNVTSLSYADGNLTSISDTYGRQLTLVHDSRSKLIFITDPLLRTTTLEYDSTGTQMLKITDPEKKSIDHSYNSLNQLTAKVDKDGRVFSYLYENLKPIAIVDGAGASLFRLANPQNWATDANALALDQLRVYVPTTTNKTDGRGNLWRHSYDKNGYVTRTVAPDGATTTYLYDPSTLKLASMTDANNNTTKYTYDALGNRTSTTNALGHLTIYTYDPVFSQMTSMTDHKGRTTKYEIDKRGNRIRETDIPGNTQEWTYDSCGNVLTQEDRNGNVSLFSYDPFGNRITITEAAGTPIQRTTIFTNDVVGQVRSRTNGNGRTTRFEYDGLNRLIRVTDPLEKVTQTFYDGMGNQTHEIDRSLNSTFSVYDERQRLVKTIDALNHVTSRAYDTNNNLTLLTDRNGNTTAYEYDEQNRLISNVDALKNMRTYTYDAVGNRLTETDTNNAAGGGKPTPAGRSRSGRGQHWIPALNVTRFAYDKLNRTVKITDAAGGVTQNLYDSGGPSDCSECTGPTPGSKHITERLDPNGNTTLFGFDDHDRLTVQIRKEGDKGTKGDESDAVTLRKYDPNGNELSVRLPNGDTMTSVYNALDQLARWSNNAGKTLFYNYDNDGKVLTLIESVMTGDPKTQSAEGGFAGSADPCTNITTNTYDELERLVRVDDLLGRVVSYTYNNESKRLSETDGNGNTKLFNYDAAYRLAKITDPLGERTQNEYDGEGNLIKVIDREGNVTTNTFDANNRRTSTTNALGHTTRWEYDHVGNVAKITDAKPVPGVAQFEYDGVHRVVREIYSDSPPTMRTFTYDLTGNLKSRTDGRGQVTTYEYNDLNYLIKRDYPGGGDDHLSYDPSGRLLSAERDGWLVTLVYDRAGRVTRSVQNGKTVNYVYDLPCRARQLTYPSGRRITEQEDVRNRKTRIDDEASLTPITRYSYDPGNRVSSRTHRNGTTANLTYNANDWVLSLEHSRGPVRVAGFGYAHDKEGNKRFEENRHDTAHSETYQYDDLYRLIDYKVGPLGSSAPALVTQTTYHLDEVGNWNSRVTDGLTETRQHNTANELTATDGAPLAYDGNGNLIGDQVYTYDYDEENRLVRVTRKGNRRVPAREVAEYQYDALGRRVVKIASPFGPTVETRYFYDDDRIIEEQNLASVTGTTYVYGNYTDEVLAMNQRGQSYYYHQNAQWSIAAMTDSAANVVERYSYDAYGRATVTDAAGNPLGTSVIGNPWMFTGRQLDPETGLYNYRARYLDPDKGRFITRDPLGIWEDNINLGNGYSYVGNNPVNRTDPTGECSGVNFWNRDKTNEGNKKRISMRVYFEQYDNHNGHMITTFDVGILTLKKKVAGFWWNTTADYIRVSGQFSGPRSPVDQWGNSGYSRSNPFTNQLYSAPVRHFTDASPTYMSCFSMSSGIYTITAYFSGEPTSATVAWPEPQPNGAPHVLTALAILAALSAGFFRGWWRRGG